jgi:hypothetical protein
LDRHALKILQQLRGYESFLGSLRTICDMGCGTGDDITWWAQLTSLEDDIPFNYRCFAVDKDETKLSKIPNLENITKIHRDFTQPYIIPTNIDLLWSHDSLQYSINPIDTLKNWNEQMSINGMLVLSVPQSNGVEHNRYISRTYNGCYYNFTPTSLIYMLAVNGFDCRDAYLFKEFGDPWIQIAVYKSDITPMDPSSTTWYDLVDINLLHPTVVNSINKHGHLRQEEIIYPWLDGGKYFIDWVPQRTELPPDLPEPTIKGVINTTTVSDKTTIMQADKVEKTTKLLKPVGITRPPKQIYKSK